MKPTAKSENRWLLRLKRYLTVWAGMLLLLALPAVVRAQLTCVTNNGTITITGYTGSGGAVTIPSTINGLPVTSIGNYAFAGNSSVTGVAIPGSVTSIGYEAFYNCSSLTSVTIPNSVIRIEGAAFAECNSLTSMTIPNSITSIGDMMFYRCFSLTSVTIPNSVTRIGNWAFEDCNSLTSVTIPKGVTSIGTLAFAPCTSLTAITVEAPNSIYSSLDGVLFNQNQTTLIQCPGGKAGSYTIPNNVTNIDNGAFNDCSSLTSVTIPNSVTSIGYSAFYKCINLTSLTIPSRVTFIRDHTFDSCTSLASVAIPNSVTNIGDSAFYRCINLTGLYFTGNAPSLVGSLVFSGDNNATVYYLPGTTGWGTTFGGRPTVLWNPQVQTSDASFGVQTNMFGFNITGTSGLVIVVDACGDLANPIWSSVGTNTLTDGSSYFSDPQWTNYPARYYRFRSP